jgi:hypothetical protein
MTGVLNVQTPRSSQGLKGEVFLIFSEKDREVGENIHESLIRSGFKVTENPDSVEAHRKPAGAVLYLASADTPKAIAATVPQTEPRGIRHQLSVGRAILMAATIGLIGFMGLSGALYQQNQAVNRDLRTAIEQRDSATTARQQMNDRLYEAKVTTDRAVAERDRAISERQQMNDQLYVANVTADRALQDKERATAERQQMNDKLYVANVTVDRALAKQQQLNDQLYSANNRADRAIKGEKDANDRIEQLQKELNSSNQRNDLLEELIRNRPVQSRQTTP